MSWTVLLLFLAPPAVFLAVALGSGMSPAASGAALLDQYLAQRPNLLLTSALELLPLVLLVLILWFRRRRLGVDQSSPDYALGGAMPILAVAIWVNFEYWSAWLPARTFLGFPHGLEFVIGPLIFAPVGLLLGLSLVWLARRVRPRA